MWLLGHSMFSHKATTHVVAIIWTDDRTSVSQGEYSKCQSVAFVVRIAYSVLNCFFKKNKNKTKHIKQKQAYKENKQDAIEDVSSKDHMTPSKHAHSSH